MCCLFGYIDYKGTLSDNEKNRLLNALLLGSEDRGIDVSGVAYIHSGNVCVYKRAVPARQLRPTIPSFCRAVMGHSRMTTQGSEKYNSNNHPFTGKCKSGKFALAHNGVIYNDIILRKELLLPHTSIQTDSYIAVQMLERESEIDSESLGRMAEQLNGSYAFTVLDSSENLFFVRGSNPLVIKHYPEKGIYIYASTEKILSNAAAKIGLRKSKGKHIPIDKGEILRISPEGYISRSRFAFYDNELFGFYDYCSPFLFDDCDCSETNEYINCLKTFAQYEGFSAEDVDNLIKEGFSLTEIEDMIYETYCFSCGF